MKYSFADVQNLIRQKALKYGLDVGFFDRIVEIESDYNPHALNHNSGAMGLGQLMPIVIQEYENLTDQTVHDPFDAEENLEVSAWYLGKRIPQMLRSFESPVNTRTIAWAYNAGIGRVTNNHMPEETESYIDKLGGFVNRNVVEKKRLINRVRSLGFLANLWVSKLKRSYRKSPNVFQEVPHPVTGASSDTPERFQG